MMSNHSIVCFWSNRSSVLLMALGALGIGLVAVFLAETLRLEACHLCIFQRLVYFIIGTVLLVAFLGWNLPFVRISALLASAVFSAWGLSVAAQQSWLQWFPESGLSCAMVEPGITERLINWLGQFYPLFFMATGTCGNKDLVILWLSLANWSFLVLSVFLVFALGTMVVRRKT